jgi:hypothetical protein
MTTKRHRHLNVGIKIDRGLWLDAELAYHDECVGLALLFDPTCATSLSDLPLFALVEPLKAQGWATLLVALIEPSEAAHSEERRFQISELAERCSKTLEWVDHQPFLAPLADRLVAVGWDNAAAAALKLASRYSTRFLAVSAPMGRLDLAGAAVLRSVLLPVQLITRKGSALEPPNEAAWQLLASPHKVWLQLPESANPDLLSPEEMGRVATEVCTWLGGIIPAHDS